MWNRSAHEWASTQPELIWNHHEERALWNNKHWMDMYNQHDHPRVGRSIIWRLGNGPVAGVEGVPHPQH